MGTPTRLPGYIQQTYQREHTGDEESVQAWFNAAIESAKMLGYGFYRASWDVESVPPKLMLEAWDKDPNAQLPDPHWFVST